MSTSSEGAESPPANSDDRDKPRTVVLPPAPYAAAVLGGWWMDRKIFPISLDISHAGFLAWLFIMAGLGLMLWTVWQLFRHHTTVNPYACAANLCVDGPFSWSRNPIYLADWLILIGLSLLLATLWPVLFAPLVWGIIRYGVIRHEEAHLAARFSDQYLAYKARVRRWL